LREKIGNILNGRIVADMDTEAKRASDLDTGNAKVEPAHSKDSVMIVSHHRADRSSTDGQRMLVQPTTRRVRRQRRALDPATLILELEMAALVRQAGDSLRQRSDDAGRRKQRSWWRRLLSAAVGARAATTRRPAEARPARRGRRAPDPREPAY
jgi:hypothetical protein